MPSRATPEKKLQNIILLSAVLYLLFVIYGSLVPLDFKPLPLGTAWEKFQRIPYLNLSIRSRADWVANILLFIPLAFLWQSWLDSFDSKRLTVIATPFLWSILIFLSCLIEFSQIFFPQRTVSQNDIIAESIGATSGILLYFLAGNAIRSWLLSWRSIKGRMSVFHKLLTLYLAGLFFYSIMPLDLTISPVEIYHKWKEGRIHLMPFATAYGSLADTVYELGTDVLLWIPVAFLWLLGSRKSIIVICSGTLGMAAGIELFQLFVFSRVSDTTDLITAALGALTGCVLGHKTRSRRSGEQLHHPTVNSSTRYAAGGAAVILWIVILLCLFWYPFEFKTEKKFIVDRLQGLTRIPFSTYYFGTEYRALTELLRKILFFIPLGIIPAWTNFFRKSGKRIRFVHSAVFLLIAGTATVVELGQVLIPGKYPDITDLVLETIGGWTGYWGALTIHRLLTGKQASSPSQPKPRQGTGKEPQ